MAQKKELISQPGKSHTLEFSYYATVLLEISSGAKRGAKGRELSF
jgi:hypothetical protein